MGFKDILEKIGEKSRQKREMLNQMSEQLRLQRLAEERQMSSNERELRKFQREDREELIKEQLNKMRKRRQRDIQFGHNPLSIPNITNHVDWEVLRNKNLFSNGKMTINEGDGNVLKNNPKLMHNNRRLFRV